MSLLNAYLKDLGDLSDEEAKQPVNLNEAKQNTASILNSNQALALHIELISALLLEPSQIPNYISKSNQWISDIDDEIGKLFKILREQYQKRFPEMETLINDPYEYATLIKAIGSTEDLTTIDYKCIIPQNVAMMSLVIASSSTSGKPVPSVELAQILADCNVMLCLYEKRKLIMKFLENQMHKIAPNLSEILGYSVAAKLVAAAGGIDELQKIPGGNFQVLGASKKESHGLSKSLAEVHQGVIGECDLAIKAANSDYRMQMIRMLSNKSALAARIDACHSSPDGSEGKKLRNKIVENYNKIQQAQMPPKNKPLPKPDEFKSKGRAGVRLTAYRKRFKMTALRKEENRTKFGPESQVEYRDTGRVFGLLGVEGRNKAAALLEKDQKIIKKKKIVEDINGMASSLAFTSTQAMELINPSILLKTKEKEKYF